MPVYDEVGIGTELSTGSGILLGLLSPTATGDEDSVGRSCGRFGLDAPATQGLLASILDAIGESADEVGGHRITRLIDNIAIGESFFPVENCIDWQESGKVAIDGILYSYSHRGDGTLSGITYTFGGEIFIGASRAHSFGAEVLDLGNPYSTIERARRAMITEYAEGADLDVIARNHGLGRPIFYASDATFRAAVRAVSYNPRGTIYGLELALDALAGRGNYVISEDLISHPCTVFITLKEGVLNTPAPFGKFYLGDPERAALGGARVDVPIVADPVTGGSPQSVCWVPHEYFVDCRTAKPSVFTSVEFDGDPGTNVFAFIGTNEAVQVTQVAGSHIQIDDTAALETGYYGTLLRTNERGQVEWDFDATFRIPIGTVLDVADTDQVGFRIADGEIETGFGCTHQDATHFLFGVIDGWPADVTILEKGEWHTCEAKRRGNRVDFLVNGILAWRFNVADLLASTNKYFAFGCFSTTTATSTVDIRQVGLSFYSHHDYFAYEEDDATLNANTLTETGFIFIAGDLGKQVRTVAGIANPQGGNNAGRWVITDVIAANQVELLGPEKTGAQTDTAHGSRITVPLDTKAFVFPDDLGKTITISGSALGGDGSYVINTLLGSTKPDDPVTDLALWDTPIRTETNVCEVLLAPPFVTETGLDYRLEPTFVNEVNVNFNLSDAGSVIAGPNTRIRLQPEVLAVGALEVMEVAYSRVLTGQIMETSVPVVTVTGGIYSHYPLYITDALGLLRAFLDDLTAAGVIPEYDEDL